jgi:SAM-dependent methyltransferase
VAVDFAPTAIDALAAHAPPTLSARRGDMRDLDAVLPDPAVFDGAWCLGNSFGYLDDAATARFLAGVARALRPGARFVVDLATAAEAVLPHLETDGADRHQAGDVSLTNTHHYDALTSTLVTQMVLERGGERDERVVRHRVFTCREVIAALERAGFEVDGIDGDLDGHPFALGAPRCLVRAIRRAEAQPE